MNIACYVVYESCSETDYYVFDTSKLTNRQTAGAFHKSSTVDFGYPTSKLDHDDFEEFTDEADGVAKVGLPAKINKFVQIFVE